MEKNRKLLVILLIGLLIVSAVVTYALILVTRHFDTTGVLTVPTELHVNMTAWDWGPFNLTGETASSSQGVSFKNLGAIPLKLSATPDTAIPEWFNDPCWSLGWTGEGYTLQPLELIDTTFTLTVFVEPTKDYMIAHQIPELAFTLGIDVTGSKVFEYYLTITSTIGGTTDPVPGVYNYTAGTNVTVQSIPDLDYELVSWLINGQVFDPTAAITICMNQSYTVEAQFYPIGTAYNLIVATTEGGTTDPEPNMYPYPEGTFVTVTAIPYSGYEFDYWTLNFANYTENPIAVTMDVNHKITAYFEEVTMVFVDPELVNVGVGETFTIAIKVANVENLYGLDIKFTWNTSLLEYISHTVKIPVETYPDGILHASVMMLMDSVNSTAGTYNVAYACLSPAPSFNGSGIVFEMTFNVIDIGSCPLDITESQLSHVEGVPIVHEVIDGLFDNTS